jgi:hypothetical protein
MSQSGAWGSARVESRMTPSGRAVMTVPPRNPPTTGSAARTASSRRLKRKFWATKPRTPAASASSATRRASAAEGASGFSTSTRTPLRTQATA